MCEKYELNNIVQAIGYQKDFFNKDVMNFFKNLLGQKKYWTIRPIKLMLTFAIMQGNPLFQLIPSMINESNAEFKDELIEHMTLEARLEFGEEVS